MSWDTFVKKIIDFFKSHKKQTSVSAIVSVIVFLVSRKKKIAQPISEVQLSYFLLQLKENLISEARIEKFYLFFRGYNNETWQKTNISALKKTQLLNLLSKNPQVQFYCAQENQLLMNNLFYGIFFAAYLFGIYISINGLPKIFQKTSTQKSDVTFQSIYGLTNAKKQLNQIIDYLSNPRKFQLIGARLRRGVIIYGPPGTGKTMLAKATANESKVNFIYCSATEFMEMYVGMGPKRVRSLFETARSKAPTIIFIDEIDSISMKRKNQNLDPQATSESEKDNTLNQLLIEIDGFNETDNVVVIAATNRIGVIDDALMRSGRFDIKIEVQLPNEQERLGILQLHLQKRKHQCTHEQLKKIAKMTEQFSGADMENISNESAYITLEDQRDTITDNDILASCQKLLKEKESINKSKFRNQPYGLNFLKDQL